MLNLFLAIFLTLALPAAAVEHNITYKTVDGVDIQFDITYPPGSGTFPLVVCIHGGGWVEGTEDDFLERLYVFSIHDLADQGYVAATVNYRVAPKYIAPAAIDDCLDATRFIIANADRFKVDTTRIAFAGISAGGHLALMSGIRGKDEGLPVKGIVALCPFTDLTDKSVITAEGGLIYFCSLFLGTHIPTSTQAHVASPAKIIHNGSPPIVLFHGTKDGIVPFRQSQLMDKAAKNVGVECGLIPVHGANHGWKIPRQVTSVNRKSFRFLERVFKEQ